LEEEKARPDDAYTRGVVHVDDCKRSLLMGIVCRIRRDFLIGVEIAAAAADAIPPRELCIVNGKALSAFSLDTTRWTGRWYQNGFCDAVSVTVRIGQS
jgi:hypothetical protein